MNKFVLKQFEFIKTFEWLSAVNLAVFGYLAAILKIKQKNLFGIINNIHLSLTMQKEILESLLWRLQISNIGRFQKRPHPPPPLVVWI